MKTTVELPDELLIAGKKRAAELRCSLRVLIERGLRHELSDAQHAGPRRKRRRHLWQPGPEFVDRLLEAATRRTVRGARVFDLHIALTAVEAAAREIWSHDRDFVSVPGLRVRNPLA